MQNFLRKDVNLLIKIISDDGAMSLKSHVNKTDDLFVTRRQHSWRLQLSKKKKSNEKRLKICVDLKVGSRLDSTCL